MKQEGLAINRVSRKGTFHRFHQWHSQDLLSKFTQYTSHPQNCLVSATYITRAKRPWSDREHLCKPKRWQGHGFFEFFSQRMIQTYQESLGSDEVFGSAEVTTSSLTSAKWQQGWDPGKKKLHRQLSCFSPSKCNLFKSKKVLKSKHHFFQLTKFCFLDANPIQHWPTKEFGSLGNPHRPEAKTNHLCLIRLYSWSQHTTGRIASVWLRCRFKAIMDSTKTKLWLSTKICSVRLDVS